AITGLILWTPVRRSFGGHVWPSSSARRHLLAQHRDVGVLTALPILLFSLTGVAMVFSAPVRTALTWILPGGPSSDLAAPALPPLPREREVDWTRVLTAAQQRFPEAELRVVAWPGANGGPVSVRLKQPAEWHP